MKNIHISDVNIDYDQGPQQYNMVLRVSDTVSSVLVPVTVDVTNVNEAPPVVTGQTVSVLENTSPGTVVVQTVATDTDAAPDNIISYTFQGIYRLWNSSLRSLAIIKFPNFLW